MDTFFQILIYHGEVSTSFLLTLVFAGYTDIFGYVLVLIVSKEFIYSCMCGASEQKISDSHC